MCFNTHASRSLEIIRVSNLRPRQIEVTIVARRKEKLKQYEIVQMSQGNDQVYNLIRYVDSEQ